MSQVNMLSIDLAPTTDSIGAKSDSSFGGADSSSGFADVMSQHQKQERGNNSHQNGNEISATEQVNHAQTTVNKENSQNESRRLNKQEGADQREVGAELLDDDNTKEQVVVQGWPDNDKNSDTNSEKTNDAAQNNEVGTDQDKSGLTAEALLALLTASDNTSTHARATDGQSANTQFKNAELSELDSGKSVQESSNTKATSANSLSEHKTITSNLALEKSLDDSVKLAKNSASEVEGDSLKNKQKVDDIEVLISGKNIGRGEKGEDIIASNDLKNKIDKLASGENKLDVDIAQTKTAKADVAEVKVTIEGRSVEIKQSQIGELAASTTTEIKADKRELLSQAQQLAQTSAIDDNVDVDENKGINKPSNSDMLVNEQAAKNLLDKNKNVLSKETSLKDQVEFTNNTVVKQSSSVVHESETNKPSQSNSTAQTITNNLQQSMSQSSDQQSSDQQGKEKQNQQSIEVDMSNAQVADKKAEFVKEPVLASNNHDKGLDRAIVNAVIDDSTTTKPLSAAQEYAVQQALSKTAADSVVQQTIKNDIKLQDETIAIYRKDFSNAVKEKVMIMMNQKVKQLEIRLDPPELGSMQVKLNLQNEQAVVNFVVQNTQAREALEQNISKLKEMLAESGIDVGESNIEQRDSSATEQDELADQQAGAANGGLNGQEEEELTHTNPNLYKASATGVDYYA